MTICFSIEEKSAFICKQLQDALAAGLSIYKTRMINSNVDSKVELDANTMNVTIHSIEGDAHLFSIPMPFLENSIVFIQRGKVKRAVCNYFMEAEQRELDYTDILYRVLFEDPTGLVPDYLVKRNTFIRQLITSIGWGTLSLAVKNTQTAINEIVNKMPVHHTNMHSWAMNNRLMIIDHHFDMIQDPNETHMYQIEKNKKYFDRGWTSIGLADGSMAENNYILKVDLKRYIPYGIKFHNPQRNLYSMLGMEGDELPLVTSQTQKYLLDLGISVTGWNLFTAFVDIPDVWEDQIIVSKNAASKMSITRTKVYHCFDTPKVKEGSKLKYRSVIATSKNGKKTLYKIRADKSTVVSIEETQEVVGGILTAVVLIEVEYTRKLKDGTKINNLASNKGIVRVVDSIGFSVHPTTGEKREIDVLSSSKAVEKRRNFTQVLEAVVNNVYGEVPVVIGDSQSTTEESIKKSLLNAGYPEDGTTMCNLYIGDSIPCIAGTVFWGITKDVEDALWEDGDTTTKNTRNLRRAGLKFSSVEFRALETRFGKDNPISDEIFSYSQGHEDLHELINILRSKKGIIDKDVPSINVAEIYSVNISRSTMLSKEYFLGTVLDDHYYPEGFKLRLPLPFKVMRDEKGEVVFEDFISNEEFYSTIPSEKVYVFDTIYIPETNLRKCWRHPTGRYGMSELGSIINSIVRLSHKFILEPEEINTLVLLSRQVSYYFGKAATMLSTKRGVLSVYGMSVRYPYSSKAVASLSNSLPKNTVQIHKDMAEELMIKDGDIVLIERFPCLGFTCLRPQKVKVTQDQKCKYTIRASGNSLGSTGLDFDGDVLYIASFHTPEAKHILNKEWNNPNKSCYNFIKKLNTTMGFPITKSMCLYDYKIVAFDDLTNEIHAEFVDRLTGVKCDTGPVIALAYNIMRIMENSDMKNDQKTNCAVEIFLDKVANSIFKQKHGEKALNKIVVESICTGNVDGLVKEGFDRSTSTIICDTIRKKAAELDINDLVSYHTFITEKGYSNIINKIVREQNKIYFASRANLEGCKLLEHLEQPAKDVPSTILRYVLSEKSTTRKTILEQGVEEEMLNSIRMIDYRDAGKQLIEAIDSIWGVEDKPKELPVLKCSLLKHRRNCYGRTEEV